MERIVVNKSLQDALHECNMSHPHIKGFVEAARELKRRGAKRADVERLVRQQGGSSPVVMNALLFEIERLWTASGN